jgi:hypothetical protein
MIAKRMLFLTGGFILMLALAGCGSNKAVSTSTNPDRLNANYPNALPVETQLILGTLKLEGTPQAVDPASAARLIPLYKLLEQMTTSGTSAQTEIDAVIEQIQGTMTPDQIHTIAAMKLTQKDMTDFFGSLGGFQRTGTRTPGAGFSGGGGFPGGGGDAGGPPAGFTGGGGGGFTDGGGGAAGGTGGAGLNQNQIATLQAGRTGSGGGATPSFLVNQLIQVLQKKTQTLTPGGDQTTTENLTPTENRTPTEILTPSGNSTPTP